MTKEYESRKRNGKTSVWFKAFEIVVSIAVCIVGILFLLMVIFPQGLWVEIFKR
jgi:hypothetical protein